MNKLKLTGFAMMMVGANVQADVLQCRALTPRSMCGTGEISVDLDTEANTFTSNIGAIACWGSDLQAAGPYVSDKAKYPFHGSTEYRLDPESPTSYFGKLIVSSPDSRLSEGERTAILDLGTKVPNHAGPIIRTNFNLVCRLADATTASNAF